MPSLHAESQGAQIARRTAFPVPRPRRFTFAARRGFAAPHWLRRFSCAVFVCRLPDRLPDSLPDRLRCAVGLRAASCADAFPPAHCRLPHGCALAAVLQKSRFPRRSCCFRPAERPSLPSPQAETFCRISAHERPATGPFRLPQALRTVPRHFEPSPPRMRRRFARKRASQRLARTRSRCAVRKPPSTRLPRSTTRHAANLPPEVCKRTHARPSALPHQRRAPPQGEKKKRGKSSPPRVIAFSASKSAIARQDYSSLPSSARAKSCGSNGRRSSIFSPRPTKVMGSSN